ncbi:polysaccharide biosynthesis protein [Petralouisia muris]|uniref:Polysaccharide biosynthesis protein n=1 Tax=Petralouisia muris TaxID=3032872 RepID=A0AC61RVE0_9FIRM|nr:nucleoside-diphosphate sugar epimerase/dehydratase [Petralouisia muris]TGY95812.1 polysaccharide biosynthesis protein [Petralouisia muris]
MKTILDTNQILIKRIFLILYDIIAVVAASLMALFIRFEGNYASIPRGYITQCLKYVPVVIAATLIIFYCFRLYSSLWTFAGAPELINITFACGLSAMAQMTVVVLFSVNMPRSYYFLYGVSLWILVFLSRFSYRGIRTLIKRQASGATTSRVMIVGAGAAGNLLVKEIHNSNHVSKRVICIVDDDKSKEGSYLHGVKVMGNRQNIPELVKRFRIDEIIIAMPSAPAKAIKTVLDVCKETGCELKRLPGVYQLVNGEVGISKLKEVDVNDLLGREPVKVNLSTIMDYVSGKVVLVTGGGGSIGSEICRQVAEHHPKMLVLVDIYENTTYDIQNELKNRYPELNLVVLIASVRNTKRMDMIFETYRPDIVYHAAAHKHVPLMEDSPNEAVKNNVLGTWKVVQAADKWKVKRFVMISTDKAVNPTNIMGATKRICEMIIQTYNNRSHTEFVAVRFGNVLGSNGSVIPLFKKQIEQGGPVTVTHPDIIRYFMTIPEAVSLVLQAGAYAQGGEIFVLDMGEPVKIADLARNLILLSGHKPGEDIQIVYTGLRPGEKLYEEMLMHEEGLQETANKLIHIGKPIKMDEDNFLMQLENLKDYVVQEPDDIRKWVQEIVPTYHPKE